jgi:type I restriction enzyme R subunit
MPKEPEREIVEFLAGVIDFQAVTDLFLVAGLEAPNGDGLEEAVLLQVQRMTLPHLAIDVMRRLIRNELQQRSHRNLALARAFARELDWIALRYEHYRDIDDTLAELIALAREMRSSRFRAAEIGMHEDQLAYYDAIALEGVAAKTLTKETLQTIDAQIGDVVRSRLQAEWVPTDSARRKLRTEIRNILRNHEFPPDAIDRAVRSAFDQAEVFAERANVLTT